MVRLTYTKYKEYGGQADEEFFSKTILEAEAFLSARTTGKVDKELSPELLVKVHTAVTLYINSMFSTYEEYKERIGKSGIKSESVLSHSVTYQDFDTSEYRKDSRKEAGRVCLEALLPTGLLNTSVEFVG